jgi:hypothetical protein
MNTPADTHPVRLTIDYNDARATTARARLATLIEGLPMRALEVGAGGRWGSAVGFENKCP